MGNLTHREGEVVVLVARGLTNRQISREIGISEDTAGNHVAKLLRKLGLRSRAQIAASDCSLGEPPGLHRNYIGEVERTERNSYMVQADRLARALGTTLAEIVAELDRGPNEP